LLQTSLKASIFSEVLTRFQKRLGELEEAPAETTSGPKAATPGSEG
jgi:hypothetical protein